MTKQEMLERMKLKNGNDILIFFRNGDAYESYFEDALNVAKILNRRYKFCEAIPMISVSRDDINTIVDYGHGVTISMYVDDDGNYVPAISEEEEDEEQNF